MVYIYEIPCQPLTSFCIHLCLNFPKSEGLRIQFIDKTSLSCTYHIFCEIDIHEANADVCCWQCVWLAGRLNRVLFELTEEGARPTD